MVQDVVYFNGLRFSRSSSKDYYRNAKTGERLHRYVWRFYNGEIPDEYDVHHIDGDKGNNDISNLQLLERHEHNKLHSQLLTEEQRAWKRNNLAINARPKASEWHKSEEGRRWHSEHAKKQMQNMKVFTNTCIVCGKEFESKQRPAKFCSGACKARNLRANRKEQKTERTCVICGKKFMVSKFSKTCTCSATCRTAYGWRNKDESKICEKDKKTLFSI